LRPLLGADGEDVRHVAQMGDGREVPHHVEGQAAIQRRIDRQWVPAVPKYSV
jgi:hypothetical protein